MSKRIFISFALLIISGIFYFQMMAQVVGPQTIKWVKVSALHHWFSSGGAEIEYGRRSRSALNTDQLDGLIWPGEYSINPGVNVGKSLWIGTTNFTDPSNNTFYSKKVVSAGRLFLYLNSEIYPQELKLVGRFNHPKVFVDGIQASDLVYNDEVDEIDPTMEADRMIVNKFHTTIGITVTRKIYVFTQQYNDNYYIYEYTFENTGIIDGTGQKKLNNTLTDVVFHWQHRYAFAGESYHAVPAWNPSGSSWGLNTVNDAFDSKHPGEFRAVWAYYGPVQTSPAVDDDIGLPRYTDGSILSGTNFAGVVVLHADKSTSDHSNDTTQPKTTKFMGSDRDAQQIDQYDASLMSNKYGFMTAGEPALTHAENIGKNAQGWPTKFADTWGGDPGGYACAQGFGPYTIAPGESIRIVMAEAVAGIMNNRKLVTTIAKNWFNNVAPFTLPNGASTTDRNIYKNTWVFTGKDSLFQTFRRATSNYNSNYSIPKSPPPPSDLNIESGGDRITLTWSGGAAETWSNFNGYRIYRAEGKTDTTFEKIFECDKNSLVHSFEDKTPRRGFNYYYYIQSKDDGSTNNVELGVPLVSSKFYTMTTVPAFLTRPPGTSLADIRVVPNPYNIKASDLQFGSSSPDRLAFFGLPPYCTIRIYTETGDLIETIDHIKPSGDEYWNSLTSSKQLVVSGLYIAYFEVTKDYKDGSGNLLYRKGENTFRKFIIIR